MASVGCQKGPWDGQQIDNYSAVPSRRVPVYADAPGVVCADEQVVTLLGYYVRHLVSCGCGECGHYVYLWTTKPDLLSWVPE